MQLSLSCISRLPCGICCVAARRSVADAWLAHFSELLTAHALAPLRAAEALWRRAVAHGGPLRFRCTVKRAGERSGRHVTSTQMAGYLGELCSVHLGWQVDLKDYDLEVLLQWNEAQAVDNVAGGR